MTSVVATTSGLASLLTDVSSISNYKKLTSSATASTNSTGLGSDTAAAASLLSDLGSIASYKGRRSSTNGTSSNEQGGKKGNSRARHSYTVGTSDPSMTIKGLLKENVINIKDDKDNHKRESETKEEKGNQQPESDPNNSTAFYDVFDFSMSEVNLSEGPAKKTKSSSRDNMARKLGRLNEQQEEEAAVNNNVSISETYNVFDFSLSTVDPKLIDEPAPKKRVSQRGSIGKLSEEQMAAARARTRRAGSQAKQILKDRPQQQPKPRPRVPRRSSSTGNDQGMDQSSGNSKPKSPQKELMSPSTKSPGRTRRVRHTRSGGRRASMGDQAQLPRVAKNRDLDQEDEAEHKVQTVRRLNQIHQNFQKASIAASEHDTTLITACADGMDASQEAVDATKTSDLQTLTQGVRSSLSTLSSLKKKLMRSNTTGPDSANGSNKKLTRSKTMDA